MAGELRSAVADWLQILSAPLTFASAYGIWHFQRNNHKLTENQVTALLMLATITIWVFLFSSYWRLTIKHAVPHRESKPFTAFAIFCISGIVGWLILCAVELYLTEAMLQSPSVFDQLAWIGLPSVAWAAMTVVLYMALGTEPESK